MSKVLVRKQLFDPKQTASNMATVSDLSNSGTIEQLGLLNLLSGPQKPLAPAAAKELGYDMDSDAYKRLRTGERIGQGLAGLYGGYRMMDAIASGRSPTSAIGAGAGAYGSVAPIARRVGVRAASRGMKPAAPPAPPVAVVKPSPLEVKEHENLQDVNGMRQMVFDPKYTGPAQPAQVKVAQPTVAMNPQEKNMLSYGAEVNKPGDTAEGYKTATTQPQQGQFTAENKKNLSSGPFETKLTDYVNNEVREKRLEQARRDQSEQNPNVLPSSDIDGI
tara:strand:+ start:53 stop:880 length:828 start_codon:yes stop_codon:yes gene_type:complete